ncbi:T6SS immunity protein Tli4 family protein [Burkholderia stagnalis]|uniref:Tle cognate immunity protein 4 C-terminal domain-containing protein n=1 Tax=Burkholderia stagnalis TaxID=1503054 RepID=A0A106P101_9BURK|nr:T6SS immunity protein Tli4 family protein [Burkholderia stagnalis]KVZ02608.1 hypothetical protein WT35_31465 [Burkholderia stagnalis]KWA53723.1 hypothetical protein WT42_15435 [Burkholderia stagnalis]KWA58837.1 hypothetical protein WT44_22070 [Burkholderia stagnalis]KWA60724.1 hypothetical protein WT43_15285 [Burkholderia stagnalis]KWC97600.1 hypothetical protein WT46_26150 [Burkholderia stagnalis]
MNTKVWPALFAGLIAFPCLAKEPSMSNVKTYCYGRYLVDLPADAQLTGQGYEYDYGRIDASKEDSDLAGFDRRMKTRYEALKAGKQKDGFDVAAERQPAKNIRIFELSKKVITFMAGGFEAYKWDRGTTFSMQYSGYSVEKLPSVVAGVQGEVLDKLQYREPDDIPSKSGFCLGNGFIAGAGTTEQPEEAWMSFRFPQWPGVVVTVRSMTVSKPGEPKLLARLGNASSSRSLSGLLAQVHVLRKGERIAAGRAGEEMLSTVPTDGGYRLHQFRWEAQGTKLNAPLDPTLIVEFQSGAKYDHGQPIRPKVTDEQATQLFDAVVNSIRLRPSAGGTLSDGGPAAPLPLGTLAATGAPCPQTGWWTCPEASGHEIVGGARQLLTQGSVMPAAQVLDKARWFDKARGKHRQFSISTTWQLVGYADPQPDTPPRGKAGDGVDDATPENDA